VGYLNTGLIGALEALAICNEMVGIARHIGRGIEVNKETLAVEVIERVGPGGHYLRERHTYDNFKKEFYFPELLNRGRYDTWKAYDGQTLVDKARSKVRNILAGHQPIQLPAEVRDKLAEIITKAEEKYRKQGGNIR